MSGEHLQGAHMPPVSQLTPMGNRHDAANGSGSYFLTDSASFTAWTNIRDSADRTHNNLQAGLADNLLKRNLSASPAATSKLLPATFIPLLLPPPSPVETQ